MTARTVRIGNPSFGRIRRSSDEERILGQIERGEVVAGPEGARLIAVRHQAAYGDVWGRACTDALTDASKAGDDHV